MNNGLPSGASIVGVAVYDTSVYVSAWQIGVYHSSDHGAHWASADAGLTENTIRGFVVSGGRLFAGGMNKMFLLGSDRASWSFNGGASFFYPGISSFAVYGSTLCVGWRGNIFVSTDNGSTWATALGFQNYGVNALCQVGTLLFAGGSAGISMSADHGLSWNTVGAGLPANLIVESLVADDSILYAGTSAHGVWRRPLAEMGTVVPPGGSPGYALYQNFPNPFNSATVIGFQLPVEENVSLSVYDLLGRRVLVLENVVRPAGYHQVSLDAQGLSSGVYFYRLQAGSFTETKRLLLLR
jgi:hypothetical protein